MDVNVDIITVTAGELQQARDTRLRVRLEGLQAAVAEAAKRLTAAESAVPQADAAVAEAERLLADTLGTVRGHLEACGMGLRADMAANPAAQQRELDFRIRNSDPGKVATEHLQQAKLQQSQKQQAVKTCQQQLTSNRQALAVFVESFIEGKGVT